MRGSGRRALRFAAVVSTTSAVALGSAGAAQAQKPEKVGDGIKTGQMSVQLFTFNGYLNNGSLGAAGNTNPITGVAPECQAGGAAATTTDCRWDRLEGLFEFLQKKGATSVELFGHAGFPSTTPTNFDTAGLERYRALLDKYGLHTAGWHGSTNEANWDARIAAAKILGSDYLGSGGVADPGINSYGAVLASAQALNRMGKKSVEGGVGPAYIHNHEQEFDRKYVHNGVLTTAFDILMAETDPRYVAAEVDVFWSSDAFDDPSGLQTQDLINKWGTRVQMLHIKDGINIAMRGATSSRAGSPRATGTGELDFRPIFAAAVNRVRYYHMEQDGGSPHDADIAFTNLKGQGPAVVGTALALPQSFPSVPAGTPAASNVVPVVIQNTGDAPLTITNVAIAGGASEPDAGDFSVVGHNCTTATGGGPLQPGVLATDTNPAVPRGTCIVNVGFKPTKTNYTSVGRLAITSNSDDATERVLLVGKSTGDALAGVGGDVPGVLQLSVAAGGGSFGTFVPGIARTYTTSLAASVTSTAGDATLSVTDPDTVAPGKLVNGTHSLASPLGIRAVGTGDSPLPAYQALGATPLALRTWSAPVSNDPLTLGLQQAIGANDPLRAGNYSKTLTFSLSTTQP